MESNVEIKTPAHLSDQLSFVDGKVERKLLLNNENGLVQYLAFGKGSSLTPHTANGDVVVTVVSGRINFNIEGKEHEMKSGDVIVMPANTEHAVSALEESRIVLSKLG